LSFKLLNDALINTDFLAKINDNLKPKNNLNFEMQ